MAVTRFPTAGDVINQVALEVGLPAAAGGNPFSTLDGNFLQLVGLLNTAGRELVEVHPWQSLIVQGSITTQEGDSGVYELPDDFAYMIDQSQWNRTQRLPAQGPLSAQEWEYLSSRQLGAQTIYAQFRQAQGKLWLWPQPPPVGQTITYEYISRAWVTTSDGEPADSCGGPADRIKYEPLLIQRLLKLKYLAAKSFDTTLAQNEYTTLLNSRTSKDAGGGVLSLNGPRSLDRLLSGRSNIPDTGYGR